MWPSVALSMSFPDELFLFLTNTIDLGVQTGDRYRFRAQDRISGIMITGSINDHGWGGAKIPLFFVRNGC